MGTHTKTLGQSTDMKIKVIFLIGLFLLNYQVSCGPLPQRQRRSQQNTDPNPENKSSSFCKTEEKDDYKILKYAAVGAGIAAASVVAVPAVLGCCGFGAAGVAAGSVAAGAQTATTAAGSAFAIAQSVGATGIATSTGALIVGGGAAAGGTVAGAVDVYCNKEAKKRSIRN